MNIDTKLLNLEVENNKKDGMKAIQFDSRNQEMCKAYEYVRDCPQFLIQKVKEKFDKTIENLKEMNKRNNDIKELSSIVSKVKAVLPIKNNIDKL